MIHIGLTGWGDHPSIHEQEPIKRSKLEAYASHFPVVELDSAFYSIMNKDQYHKWSEQTPTNFSFVVKSYQAFTGHDRKTYTRKDIKEMFRYYQEGIQPLVEANKLNCILFQFPPWFKLSKDNISKLRFIRSQFDQYKIALEFRNRTWFQDHVRKDTLQFMKEEGWIHSICDEPQAGEGSVPMVPVVTHPSNTIIRFHGRNVMGWNKNGQENWRKVRFLYRYSEQELSEWVERIYQLNDQSQNITVLFNNNSGGDAYDNAKQLQHLLNIHYHDLNPRQMNLF
ncbi:DUF72 domain-containing protein [Tenuibacillus multivorans]|uniref:Uncharacterized conserved protein YecE, DUF72 family n=1 Tax=Tenuibacillus multivorans TaxID=237069 RepID=A0A1H0CR61_9BACI|nr:DUF72 domain-containing protein [Tenuibacillus multivorans]GEL76201.1 UPF0759 protein YunF [Tenuibacillus multivorans]SDN60211.1 Uncharacterized conserved protein YecE, DUF72 family [Tenuibacillus multivorans]